MSGAIVPLYVMGAFLVVMALLLLLAVRAARSSRRGFSWSDDDASGPDD